MEAAEAAEASEAAHALMRVQSSEDNTESMETDSAAEEPMPTEPIPSSNNPSGYKGVYAARNGRWQAQVNHHAIGGYATAWEAGVAVAQALYREKMLMRSNTKVGKRRKVGPH